VLKNIYANIQYSALDIFEVLVGAFQIWNGNIVNWMKPTKAINQKTRKRKH